MKHLIVTFLLMASLISLPACKKETAPAEPMMGQHMAAHQKLHKGAVTETMNSGGYTYVSIKEDGKEIWAASQPVEVAVGDVVEFPAGMPMVNFTSKTLNRTFDAILFAPFIRKAAAEGDMQESCGEMSDAASHAHPPAAGIQAGSIEKVDGGYTIAEIFAQKEALKGKTVKVRGRVIKFTANIMGTNWIHLQDGTGSAGTNDLTVTSTQEVKPGSIVVASGQLDTDKDIGAGYHYDAIIEKATVTVEQDK
jgi:hypothetical protein